MDLLGKKLTAANNLIAFQKANRKAIRRGAIKSIKHSLESEALGTVEFMCRDEERSRLPYMFVDRKGIILGYTKGLEVALNLQEDAKGKHYLEVFYPESNDPEVRSKLKRYFSSLEKLSVPFEVQDGKKKRHVTIIKEEPIYENHIDISFLGYKDPTVSNSSEAADVPERTIRAVSYVPIKIEPRKTSKVHFYSSSAAKKTEEENQVSDAIVNLIIKHGWEAKRISAYKEDYGRKGLTAKYQELESEAQQEAK